MASGACQECGLDRSTVGPREAITTLLSLPARYTSVLGRLVRAGDLATKRPSENVWSATEYAAHTADAMWFICDRAALILREDDPVLPRFGDPDGRDYSAVQPEDAIKLFMDAALKLAETLEGAEPADWDRAGHNELGSATLLNTATYGVHEGVHHLHDMERVAAQLLSRSEA